VAVREIPVLAMLTTPVDVLRRRADALAGRLTAAGASVAVADTEATVGGGAFPTARIPSAALAFDRDVQSLEGGLRGGALPIIGRIEHQRFLLDLRTVPADRDDAVADAVIRTIAALGVDTSPVAQP
jgi:L-seryl-tRNA(Ser) seleniumtransferase